MITAPRIGSIPIKSTGFGFNQRSSKSGGVGGLMDRKANEWCNCLPMSSCILELGGSGKKIPFP